MNKTSKKSRVTKSDIKDITLFASAIGNIFQAFNQAGKAQTIEELRAILNRTHADKIIMEQQFVNLLTKYNDLGNKTNEMKKNFDGIQEMVKKMRAECDEKDREIAELKKKKGDKQ